MLDLTFRQLEVFVRVVDGGSFRAGAERLGISPVSVSTHIKALENQLGTALFQRERGATPALTTAGEDAYRRAKDLLRGRAELLRWRDVSRGTHERSRLRIAAHGYIAERFSKRLAGFASDHPEIEIELERRPFEGVLKGLRTADIEVGFFLSRGPVPEIESESGWQEDIAFYVSPRHPLAEKPAVRASELSRFPFYYLPASSHLRSQMDGVLCDLDLHHCPTAMVSDDHVLIMQSLGDGRSFACLFADGIEQLVENGTLRKLHLTRSLPHFDVRYAVRGPYQRERSMCQLIECLTTLPA